MPSIFIVLHAYLKKLDFSSIKGDQGWKKDLKTQLHENS